MNSANLPQSPVVVRPSATRDIEQIAEYLDANATPAIALKFREAIQSSLEHLARMPLSGAPRSVNNPRLAGLRMWGVSGFRNYLLFYITPGNTVEIVRVIHGAQDTDAILERDEV